MDGGHCFLGNLVGGKLDIEVVAAAAPLRLSSYLPSAQSPLVTATLCWRRRLVQCRGDGKVWRRERQRDGDAVLIKSDGMWLFWLLIIFLPPAWSLQPRCKLTTLSSQAPGTTRGEVIFRSHKFCPFSILVLDLILNLTPSTQVVCTCRSFQPTYTGNLNFVKGALAGAARLDGKLDVVLTNCSHLNLELNFHTLGRRPVDLRIENSGNVRVGHVELAAWEGHSVGVDGPHIQELTVQGVQELVLQGAISCARCNSAFNHYSGFY